MQNIINSWSNLKKIAEEKVRIPIAYVIFILLNVCIYSKKGMIISNIATSNQTVKTVLELFLELLSIIYNNIYIVFVVTISIFLLILFYTLNIYLSSEKLLFLIFFQNFSCDQYTYTT